MRGPLSWIGRCTAGPSSLPPRDTAPACPITNVAQPLSSFASMKERARLWHITGVSTTMACDDDPCRILNALRLLESGAGGKLLESSTSSRSSFTA